MCVDEQYNKLYQTYFGKDTIDKFLNDMTKESEYCSKLIGTETNRIMKILIILLNVEFIKKHMKKVK